jgi:hypothetical protein
MVVDCRRCDWNRLRGWWSSEDGYYEAQIERWLADLVAINAKLNRGESIKIKQAAGSRQSPNEATSRNRVYTKFTLFDS